MTRPISTFHAALNRARWNRVRWRILERDNWTCQTCGGYGNQCDHRQPLFQGGAPYDLSNLQILCEKCHWAKCATEQGGPTPPEVLAWDAYLASVIQQSDK